MPVSQPKSSVRSYIQAFEKALTNAEGTDGRVDMGALRAELKKANKGKELDSALSKSLDVLEQRFARSSTVSTGCGSSTVKNPPKSLSAKEVKSVFNALIEAKTKGLDKIDADGDGKITRDEAQESNAYELSDKLAEAAAVAATSTGKAKKTKPKGGGVGRSSTVGC